ncbi:MAG: methyltransferase domain-containing protein [Terrimicrobiaceae bacterium]
MSLHFVREFFRFPGEVGAVWPSSRALAEKIVDLAGVATAPTVLEIGAGTGVFTRRIADVLPTGANCLVLERNAGMVRGLKKSILGLDIVEGCATRLADYWNARGWKPVRAVVSGLPWAVFGRDLQEAILTQILAISDNETVFTTFGYFGPHRLAKGRAFRAMLDGKFREVRSSPVVLRNFPPAFIYRCVGPTGK